MTTKATPAQIATVKLRIVALASQQAVLQTHRDALEAQLAALDPADTTPVAVPGYPVPKRGIVP